MRALVINMWPQVFDWSINTFIEACVDMLMFQHSSFIDLLAKER